MFKEKTYAMLPNIKIKSWNKEVLPDLNISSLNEKKFMAETVINEALLLGWNHLPMEEELKKLKANDKFKDLIAMESILTDFKFEDIQKEKAVFMWQRVFYLNNRMLQRKYLHSDKVHKKRVREDFKKVFGEYFIKYKHKIDLWEDDQWDRIMQITIVTTHL